MSFDVEAPSWGAPIDLPLPDAPPPIDTSNVDPHAVEGMVNSFIGAQDDVLHNGDNAFFRSEGADAVNGAPTALDQIDTLHKDTLDGAPDEATRLVAQSKLDLHRDEARDAIGRHVDNQRDVVNRETVAERQRLIERTAARDHADDEKLAGLAEANASTAAKYAQMTGQPEAEARAAAKSAVWTTAIDQRLANGNSASAVDLFDKVSGQLSPADLKSLETPMQVARHDQTADAWIAREKATDGPPLLQRAATDPELHDDARNIVLAKVDSQETSQEHGRTVKVQELDDRLDDATRTQALRPGAYKPGTYAKLAEEYEAAGEPAKATLARRMAEQDGVLVPFSSAPVAVQQRLIDGMPKGDLRNSAIAIKEAQASALKNDAFAAGTSMYPEIGKPVPIEDTAGRVRQARLIEQYSGVKTAPYSVPEIDAMSRTLATGTDAEKQAVNARIDAIPPAMRPVLTPVADAGSAPGFRIEAAPPPATPNDETETGSKAPPPDSTAPPATDSPSPAQAESTTDVSDASVAPPSDSISSEAEVMSDAVEEVPQAGQQYAQARGGRGVPEPTGLQRQLIGQYRDLTETISRLEPQNRFGSTWISSPEFIPTRQQIDEARTELQNVLNRAARRDPNYQPFGPSTSSTSGNPVGRGVPATEIDAFKDRLARDAKPSDPVRGPSATVNEGKGAKTEADRAWPENDGFLGPRRKEVFHPGARLDRYGGPGGSYLSPEGTPFSARSLPAEYELRPRYVYEVVKPIEIESGFIAPWFGQPGLGQQIYLGERTVQQLIDSGHLREVR